MATLRSQRIISAAWGGLVLVLGLPLLGLSQASSGFQKGAVRVYLDSPSLPPGPIQSEVGFVSFVSSIADAQVVVRITPSDPSAGPGYDLAFTGQNEFAGMNDALKVPAEADKKPEDVQKDLVRALKLALLRYVTKTDVSSRVTVSFLDQVKPTAVVDPWNFWVFSLNVDAFMSGQQMYNYAYWGGSFSANRVTEAWKVRTSVRASRSKQVFSVEDFNYTSIYENESFSSQVVKSLGPHWSVGAFLDVSSSTYSNLKWGFTLAPAVEYDVFPYAESTKRQLRILYRAGATSARYREMTIYDRTRETLWSESLAIALEVKQPWGTISSTLTGFHYFHDFSKNRLTLNGEVSLRIFKGFNFNISGGGSRIHDQISIAKGETSYEDVLLRRKQLETSYDYYFSLGISYTFGSIGSNVVNPRFNSSGGIHISF
jgi:hypothetical protein